MVINTNGYIQLIEYLSSNLFLFENSDNCTTDNGRVIEVIENEMSNQIVSLCEQNSNLTVDNRNTIIHEIDLIIDDLREVLSTVMNNRVTDSQHEFIKEFAMLVKNLFDSEIHTNFNLN